MMLPNGKVVRSIQLYYLFDNQMFIIIGGICFAPTIALIIVKDFLEYINVDRNNNKN